VGSGAPATKAVAELVLLDNRFATLVIGTPSFFLALAPNRRRYLPGFVGRVLRFAIPAGLIIAAATFSAGELTKGFRRGSALSLTFTAVARRVWRRRTGLGSKTAASSCLAEGGAVAGGRIGPGILRL
jgi:hypothetical protein